MANTNTNPNIPQQNHTEEERTRTLTVEISQRAWEHEQETRCLTLLASELEHEKRLTQKELTRFTKFLAADANLAAALREKENLEAQLAQLSQKQAAQEEESSEFVFFRPTPKDARGNPRAGKHLGNVVCHICHKELSSKYALAKHHESQHRCQVCSEVFPDKGELWRHARGHA